MSDEAIVSIPGGPTAEPPQALSESPAEVPLRGPRELPAILEALLFISHEPVTIDRLAGIIAGVTRAHIQQALVELRGDLEKQDRGIQVVELAGGFQMVARPDCAPWVKRLGKIRPAAKLSRSGLETLAIIAYKQPIVRAEIEQIRGVETAGVLRTLLERKLVRIVGRKDIPGRPIMYGTTKYFLQHFGLRDLSELPPLRELVELGGGEQTVLPMNRPLLVEAEAELSPADDSLTPSGFRHSTDESV